MGRGVWPLAGPTVLFFLRKDKERGGGGRGQMGACSLAGGGRVDRLAHRFVFCCVFFFIFCVVAQVSSSVLHIGQLS